jgi:hypothetical protein
MLEFSANISSFREIKIVTKFVLKYFHVGCWAIRQFKLRVIRQTANAKQRKFLRYQTRTSKWTCCFKIEIHNYSFDARKKIWNENVERKLCQESSKTAQLRTKACYAHSACFPDFWENNLCKNINTLNMLPLE